jgi:hypothetical protein
MSLMFLHSTISWHHAAQLTSNVSIFFLTKRRTFCQLGRSVTRGDRRLPRSHLTCLPPAPQIAHLCGLWAMETRWISVLVGGRAPPPVFRASFFVFRVRVCRGGAQVVVATSRAIRSPGKQHPHRHQRTLSTDSRPRLRHRDSRNQHWPSPAAFAAR